jgi:phage shock protein PspC (stress-responsive transcriptional regulator)
MPDQPIRDAPPLASRYRLVRPLQGRYVAGVCAALGRATGTDPVLWRVVLAVLVCFLGIGALVYLVGWLLTPEEGDTASPVEAMLGRGRSSTSPVLAVLLSIGAVFLLVLILPRPLYLVLAGATGLAVLVLISRFQADGRSGTGSRPTVDARPTADRRPPGGPAPPPPATAPAPAAGPPDPAAAPTLPGGLPFAPHGPYAGPPPPAARRAPVPRPAPRERSLLPVFVFSAALAVLGGLGMLDLTGLLGVPAAGYLAGSLGVVGAGLLVGAWWGRARPLITLGIVLALALPAVHAVETVEQPEHVGDLSWAPQDRAELRDEYELAFGSGVVDLRGVDFAGRETEITIRITFGEMRVAVPADVAVEATVDSQLGGATVLGRSRDGVSGAIITDPGRGGPASGRLVLDLHARFGHIEVHR